MSYSRTFTKTISVHYSGSVSYPASQSGGTRSYSGTAYENVTVTIHVDTDDFDDSIRDCNNGVGLLTGSVVATEAAQCKSIAENANKVADTIVSGFFKTVRSEISQQVAELRSRLDATLIHLNELARRCVAKQTQMSTDYHRLTDRYSKVFNDLNNELENRIYSLDQPVFKFRRQADVLTADASGKARSGALVAVGGAENASLLARLSASVAKRDALLSMRQANDYLSHHRAMERLLSQCLLDTPVIGIHSVPVVYVSTRSGQEGVCSMMYTPDIIPTDRSAAITRDIESARWACSVPKTEIDRVRNAYNSMIVANITDKSSHADRVRRYMSSLFNLADTEALAPAHSENSKS